MDTFTDFLESHPNVTVSFSFYMPARDSDAVMYIVQIMDHGASTSFEERFPYDTPLMEAVARVWEKVELKKEDLADMQAW